MPHPLPFMPGCSRLGMAKDIRTSEKTRIQNEGSCALSRAGLNRRHHIENDHGWPRGGVVTQRTANPRTPVQFRARPPNTFISEIKNLSDGQTLSLWYYVA